MLNQVEERTKTPAPAGWPEKLKPKLPNFAALLLAVATVAAYLPVRNADFVNFDDDLYVYDNNHVTDGLTWDGVAWAFRTGHAANWHPLTWLSHMLDCQLFGPHPGPEHLVNLAFHVANALLLFLLLRQITGALWRSLAVAALFALHPLHVESVAWISERKDVLSTFFLLLTTWAYVRYASLKLPAASVVTTKFRNLPVLQIPSPPLEERRPLSREKAALLFYCLALFFFALGLMSKPMLVTLPCVLLLLDYWPLGRFQIQNRNSKIKILLEKLPFFLLAVLSSVATLLVQKRAGAVWSVAAVPLGARLENALVSYGRYLGKLFLPIHLSFFYPYPSSWALSAALLCGLLLLGISTAAILLRHEGPWLLVGWLWFLGTLVPVIGLVQVGWQSIADRYTYVPFIGIFIALAWGIERLTRGWSRRPLGLAVIGTAVMVVLAVLTYRQAGVWRDSESLCRHSLAVTGHNFIAHHNLAMALNGQKRFQEAMPHFLVALELRPNSAESHNGLGDALYNVGRLDEALEQYRLAVELEPDSPKIRNNLGIALIHKGLVEQAVRQFQEAIKTNPDYAKAHANLGMAFQAQGRLDDAIPQLQYAVKLAPRDADARNSLAMALGRKGRPREAISQLIEARKLRPNDPQIYHNLGLGYARLGQTEDAIREFEHSLMLRPDSPETHASLGLVLAQSGRRNDAIVQFQEALRLRPNYPEVQRQLDALKPAKP